MSVRRRLASETACAVRSLALTTAGSALSGSSCSLSEVASNSVIVGGARNSTCCSSSLFSSHSDSYRCVLRESRRSAHANSATTTNSSPAATTGTENPHHENTCTDTAENINSPKNDNDDKKNPFIDKFTVYFFGFVLLGAFVIEGLRAADAVYRHKSRAEKEAQRKAAEELRDQKLMIKAASSSASVGGVDVSPPSPSASS